MDPRFTAKELAQLVRRDVSYIYAMRRQGFRMAGRTATLAEALRWQERHPNPRASGYIPVKCSFTGQPDLAILDTNE